MGARGYSAMLRSKEACHLRRTPLQPGGSVVVAPLNLAVMLVVVLMVVPLPSVTVSVSVHVMLPPLATPVVSTLPPGPATMVGAAPLKVCSEAGSGLASSQAYVQLAMPQVDGPLLTGTVVLTPSSTVTL